MMHGPLHSNFALQLEDEVTILTSVEGGRVSGEVAESGRRSGSFSKKHIAKILYEDITCKVSTAMSPDLAGWINASTKGRRIVRDGAILACDQNLCVHSKLEFYEAYISEVSIPALGGNSKESGYLTVRLTPRSIRAEPGEGKLLQAQFSKHKLWNTSNFRLDIDNLGTGNVLKIDQFSVSIFPGKGRSTEIHIPDLWVTLIAAQCQSWQEWFDDFVLNGNNGEYEERRGAIVFLGTDLKTELGRIDLHHLGIFSMSPEIPTKPSGLKTLKAGLYCEIINFKLGEGSQW